tara:strand:- start:1385 stop:1966 length:582 start_codon:yes stop_codon:yes gene_type:complete
MQVIELVIDEESDEIGVQAISVVNQPAVEVDFIALNKQVMLKASDEKKRILTGVALIPSKQIYRYDESIGEYYIYFSKETIEKASQLFLKESNQKNATYEHAYDFDGGIVVESWIVSDPQMDKAKHYGFDVPKGTWMISMKIENEKVWQDVLNGKVKGFSIEGYFADKMQLKKLSKDEMLLEKIRKIINEENT